VSPPASSAQRPAPTTPYRGPDRRGVTRFTIPARLPTLLLLALGLTWIAVGDRVDPRPSATDLIELQSIAATVAIIGGVAFILRWRIDGIARGWWCGWALVGVGLAELAFQPARLAEGATLEFVPFMLVAVLLTQAILGPEVDATIGPTSTVVVVGSGIVLSAATALLVTGSPTRADVGRALLGAWWLALAATAALKQRVAHDAEAGWILPVTVALALGQLVSLAMATPGATVFASEWFELIAMALACVAALGGVVQAAVHHRTRAMRERIERERELANRHRVEESFADRLHELRSTVVAIEGGVHTLPEDQQAAESTLRAALIAEIRRLRTLVNEAPVAAGAQTFDVTAALLPTIELQRANGQEIVFDAADTRPALGRPDEIAQVVQGLLANAAKYAPGAPVTVTVRHLLDEIAIRVEDGGPGIDPEYWDQIFERGFRVDPGAEAGGSGIGLSVARRIVRSQDGDLWVEDGPGGGAAFVLSIPAAPALRLVHGAADEPEDTGPARVVPNVEEIR
jgi:signal transduction histidine kinase